MSNEKLRKAEGTMFYVVHNNDNIYQQGYQKL